MEFIKPGSNIDFVGRRVPAIGVSAVLVTVSLVVLAIFGPHYGIDFTGGTVVQLGFKQPTTMADVRGALAPLGMENAEIQDFTDNFAGADSGSGSDFLIRMPVAGEETGETSRKLTAAMRDKFGDEAFEVKRIESVGPRVGETLRTQAIMAVLFATLMMGAYVWFRFELRFGIGAMVALAHDVIVAVGALSLFAFEIDLTVVAALLTVVGFSVNDTVIISDRIRENMRKYRKDPLEKIINLSINETLSRTIITTGTALLVILALFFLGGNVIRGFAFALLVGFVVGTYSSIFVSAPIVLWFEKTPTPKPAGGTARAAA
jgi:preprotein translocase subunit SecF